MRIWLSLNLSCDFGLRIELRLWRATRGMMYNDEAIRLTAILEEEDSNAFKGGDFFGA